MSKTKTLYVLMTNGGDGSCNIKYTFDLDFIMMLTRAAEEDKLDYDDIGCGGGEGFNYETIEVPVKCTPESLGIEVLDPNDYDFE